MSKRRKKKVAVQEDVAPNLIPMVDIMFLLLLFFMLGSDMGQRDLEEVQLPEALSVKEDKEKEGKHSRFTVNVYHVYEKEMKCAAYLGEHLCLEEKHWRIGIKGRDYTDSEKLYLALKNEASVPGAREPGSKFSERPVMVRADKSAPYGEVQRVINACARAGIYKIEVGAATPLNPGK